MKPFELNLIRWFPLIFIPLFYQKKIKSLNLIRLFLICHLTCIILILIGMALAPAIWPNDSYLLPENLRIQPFLYWGYFILPSIATPTIVQVRRLTKVTSN